MKASAEMTCLRFFFFFFSSCRQLRVGRRAKFRETGVWRPWWVQVTSGFLCMCAVCSPQALTCGFNPLYEDRVPPLICSLSPHKPSMVSWYLSHQLYLGSFSFTSGISLFYLANSFHIQFHLLFIYFFCLR